nr:hypothetical protein [Endozoicomonas sp.]
MAVHLHAPLLLNIPVDPIPVQTRDGLNVSGHRRRNNKDIEHLNRFNIPPCPGITAIYISLYRRWLDKHDPDHHLLLLSRRHKGKVQHYVRLTVECRALQIKIDEEFLYNESRPLEKAKQLAREQRDTLSDELFCLKKRLVPEVPGIYHYPRLHCYKADISTGTKRVYLTFSYRYSPEADAYDRAVRALFDARQVEYSRALFIMLRSSWLLSDREADGRCGYSMMTS